MAIRAIAGEMRGLLACHGIELGDRHPGAFTGEQDRGGTADPGARAGDEGDLAGKSRHRLILLDYRCE
jgi:hypothetical protein